MTRARWRALACIAAAVAVAMGPAIVNGFVYDDLAAIAGNPRITAPDWQQLPLTGYWQGALWRPFTSAVYALQWLAGRGAPWLYHLVSLAAYAALGWLLYLLLVRIAGRTARHGGAALVAVAIFLAHPVHVEVVANAVGQAELWTAIAMVAALLVYLDAREGRPTTGKLLLLLTMVTIGIAAKEQGFVIPVVLVAAEWLLLGGRGERWPARIRFLVPVAALAIGLFLVRAAVLGNVVGETPSPIWHGVGVGGRALTFLAVLPVDLRLVVWPFRLAAEYGPPAIAVGGAPTAWHAAGLLIVAAGAAAIVATRKRSPWIALGLLLVAATLAPVSNLLAPTGTLTAERLLFLPTIGLTLAGFGAWTAHARQPALGGATIGGWAAAIVASVVIVAFTLRSETRVAVWRTQGGFFDQLVVDAPRVYRAWKVAGAYRESIGDSAGAIDAYQRAWSLWPHDAQVAELHGQLLRRAGRCDEAIPVFAAGLAVDSSAASLRAKLIECLITLRRWDAAERYAEEAVRLGEPEFAAELARIDSLRSLRDSTR